MPYDYGTLYGMGRLDPMNSRVYLSRMITGTNVVNFTTLNQLSQTLFVEDDENVNEFAYIYSRKLYVYDVSFGNSTGTTSIIKTQQIDLPVSMTGESGEGIKRINNNLFYIYYLDNNLSTTQSVDIRRAEASSTGVVDGILATITPPAPPSGLAYDLLGGEMLLRIERKLYFGITATSKDGTKKIKHYFYVYCFDMDSEELSLINSILLPTLSGDFTYSLGTVYLQSSMGNINYIVLYSILIVQDAPPFYSKETIHIQFNGNDTILFDQDPFTSPTTWATDNKYIYNYRVSKLGLHFTHSATEYYVVVDSVSGVGAVTNDDTQFPNVSPISFCSQSVFPKIGYIDPDFHWLDGNGRSLGAIVLDGVTVIYNIFPTLDSINGSLCVSAGMTLGNDAILSVDATTGDVLAEFSLPNFPWGWYHSNQTGNHGNFFFHWRSTSPSGFYASYIIDTPYIYGVGESQMLEKN